MYTWHSPNGLTHNQIDCIVIPHRFKLSIHEATTITYPEADINSDRDLVLCNTTLKLRSHTKSKNSRVRFDVEKLQNK